MKRYFVGVAALAAALMMNPGSFSTVESASAQDFNSRDRLLLFYNYYNSQQNSRRLLAMQQNVARGIQSNNTALSRLDQQDPIEQYVRRGQSGVGTGRRPLPAIYGGGGGRRQYFMRINYFNPPRR